MERQKRIIIMMALTGCYFFVELIVGRMTNCVSLTADAFHVMSDCMALGVTLSSIKVANRKPTSRYTYGLKRAELVGGLVNSIFLLSICFTLVTEGLHRLFEHEEITQPEVVISTASVGLLINLVGLLIFKEHSHLGGECKLSHGHSHSHSHSNGGEKEGSLNQKALFLHIAGDAMASVAVIIAGLISWKATNWEGRHLVDPILSIVISLILVYSALPLAIKTCDVMLQKSPIPCTNSLEDEICAVHGVRSIVALRIWSLTETSVIGTCTLEVTSHVSVSTLHQIFKSHSVTDITVEQQVVESQNIVKKTDTSVDVEVVSDICTKQTPAETEEAKEDMNKELLE